MALNTNKRIFWAVQGAGLAPVGSTSYTKIRALQTIGMTTTFNLEQLFEIGQIALFDNIENLPSVEVTLEKVLDGSPLTYHLATSNATSASLFARTDKSSMFTISVFADSSNSASGTPNAQVTCSGMFVNSLNYTFPVDSRASESVTLTGNVKTWASGSFTFQGSIFDNTDGPQSGIIRRQHVLFGAGSGMSLLPSWSGGGIPGISHEGYNIESNGKYAASVQNITISADMGREDLLELGRKNPFFKFIPGAVEVTTEIEVLTTDGDLVDSTANGTYNGNDLLNKQIVVQLSDGSTFNMGKKNKLTNVQYGGADAGQGNATCTYSYSTYNDLTITHPLDPAGLTQTVTIP